MTLTVMTPSAGTADPGARPVRGSASASGLAGGGGRDAFGELFGEAGSFTRLEVQRELGISKASANNLLSRLVEEGTVVRLGRGPSTRYALA